MVIGHASDVGLIKHETLGLAILSCRGKRSDHYGGLHGECVYVRSSMLMKMLALLLVLIAFANVAILWSGSVQPILNIVLIAATLPAGLILWAVYINRRT